MIFKVRKHIARMTGACWFIVVDQWDCQADSIFYDDYNDAQLVADKMNGNLTFLDEFRGPDGELGTDADYIEQILDARNAKMEGIDNEV